MKIIQQTDTVLVLRLRPWLPWLFSATSAVLGVLIMTLLAQVVTLTCQKTESHQGQCVLREQGTFYSTSRNLYLANLHGAFIKTSNQGQGYTYQVQILVGRHALPLTSYYSSGYAAKQAQVDQVNAFLRSPGADRLTVVEDNRWFAYPFGGLFLVSALMVTGLLGQQVTCIFDRSTEQLVLKQQGLLQAVYTYPLPQIVGIEIEASNGSVTSAYRISVRVKGDRPNSSPRLMPLTYYFSADRRETDQAAETICQFLSLDRQALSEASERKGAIAELIQIWESLHPGSDVPPKAEPPQYPDDLGSSVQKPITLEPDL